MTDLDHRLAVATRVATAAGRLAKDYFDRRHELEIELKGRQDLVSVADRAVEELISDQLGSAFPEDGFLGEEGGGGEAERLWVIDPIDGTMNFLRGLPYWCTVLAYVENGVTELGLTVDSVHDEIFIARRGHGATRNGTSISVSGCADPHQGCVALAFNFKQPAERYIEMIRRLTAEGLDHRRMGSSALALCHVADGRLDAAVTLSCSSWDVIAGLLAVAEAGGLATRFTDGHRLTDTRAVAACTPGVADPFERATGLSLPPSDSARSDLRNP
jgi:myo-inositol-1(or 4)-monophosphatase